MLPSILFVCKGYLRIELKTPADPHLHQLFYGEEVSKFARLWTRGYDVYTPYKNIAFHDYTEAVVDPYIGPMRPGGNEVFFCCILA